LRPLATLTIPNLEDQGALFNPYPVEKLGMIDFPNITWL